MQRVFSDFLGEWMRAPGRKNLQGFGGATRSRTSLQWGGGWGKVLKGPDSLDRVQKRSSGPLLFRGEAKRKGRTRGENGLSLSFELFF